MKKSKNTKNENRIAEGKSPVEKKRKNSAPHRKKSVLRKIKNGSKAVVRFLSSLPTAILRFVRSLPDRTRELVKKLPSLGARSAAWVRRLFKKLFEEYKHWLYNDGIQKVVPRVRCGLGRASAAVITIALFLAFGLYYMGLYDISFIDRPEAWRDNGEKLYALFYGEETPEAPPADDAANTSPAPDTQSDYHPSETITSVDISYTLKRKNKSSKINSETVFLTSDELEAQGYYLTDAPYDENTCEVGLMTFDYELPEDFSYRNMTVRDWQITEYDDGRASTVEDTEASVKRPAIYLYMGYIMYDDAGRALYLADSNGTLLMSYDDSYIPAMARNSGGKPLFYKNRSFYAEAPVAYEVNEAGEEVVTETKGVYLTGKEYFCLSASGTYFVSDDYVEERDGRGLNFDFPSSYGLADGQIIRVGIMTPRVSTFLDGKSALVNFMNWNYFLKNDPSIPSLDDIISRQTAYNLLSVEEKLKAIEAKASPADIYNVEIMLPYSFAFNYNGGYATVVTDETGEEPKYETKELRVINNYGEMMFSSKKEYYNSSIKNYCSDRYLLPLSKGEDSVGHLYFDHGLLRLRKVCYDNYQLEEFGDFRVNSDEDVLVYPSGKEFPIPAGYTLKGYSDGIMVLERNGLYGYMNYMGKWIADPEYINAEAFHGGVGVVTEQGGKVCALNTNGDFVLPLKYDYIQNRSDGLIAAYSAEEGWQIYGIFTK